MFDDVPTRIWLLIAIAAVAWPPAHYAFQHLAASPARRDITKPPEDLAWRTSAQLVRSLVVLVALTGLSLFIFTPAAERFAQSPSFWPILAASFGAWALYTVPVAFMAGEVQPLIKGINATFTRQDHPNRFWASLTWNAILGCLAIWAAYALYADALEEPLQHTCYGDQAASALDKLTACNELIGNRNPSHRDYADLVAARGKAYYHLNDYSRALADFDEAIRLRPDGSRAYFSRGLMFLNGNRLDDAIADFTKARELDRRDVWPLANRGLAHAWRKDRPLAEKDFRAARAIDPSNPVMLRGEAILAMDAGDPATAVKRLTESLKSDPDNIWALRMRAEMFLLLGDNEKSWADSDKVDQLRRDGKRAAR